MCHGVGVLSSVLSAAQWESEGLNLVFQTGMVSPKSIVPVDWFAEGRELGQSV